MGASTPIATTPLARDYDSQSLHSEPGPPQGTSVEHLRDLCNKRIVTLNYLRMVHEGGGNWFHTIMLSRQELDREFNNQAMRKRTARYSMLGMSLSNLLEIQQPQDLLRGLLNTLQEYDQSKEDGGERPKMRLFNRTKIGKRIGLSEYSGYDASESYLMIPQVPFALDYHETLVTFFDVLSEVYSKVYKLLGPSPIPHSTQQMMGPLGPLAPQAGVGYLFTNDFSQNPYSTIQGPNSQSNPNLGQFSSEAELNSSLWGIANASLTYGVGAGPMYGGGLASPPPTWTPGFADMVLKIDGKFKKIISTLLKELDQLARNGIKDELASLDPLLRNINIPDEPIDGKAYFEYDG